MSFLEFLSQPWPWWVAGPGIVLVMYLAMHWGRNFGVSSTLRTWCAMGGGGSAADFFRFNWRDQLWNIVFVGGVLLGGWLAWTFIPNPEAIALNPKTIAGLAPLGIEAPGPGQLAPSIFSWQGLVTSKGFLLMVVGGFLVGFGSRYGGGCTSGHAISGLSNLQWPSLVAVVGFFIGGLLMTHVIFPWIL